METQIKRVHFRGILESRGKLTVEAEVKLADGSTGVASAPVAIMPGRLECTRSYIRSLGPLDGEPEFAGLRTEVEGRCFESQQQFDVYLEERPLAVKLGADVRLVLSVAFCRACAAALDVSLLERLMQLASTRPAIPRPLVNIFSGGIHDRRRRVPFQQIMFAPDFGDIVTNINAALTVYSTVEDRLQESGGEVRYSASSGMLVDHMDHEELLEWLNEVIRKLEYPTSRSNVAVDVAAEHLHSQDGSYLFGESTIDGVELMKRHLDLVRTYNVGFLEDPFDAADLHLWRELTKKLQPTTCVVGDDLFATDSARIEPGLATGIILKPNQTGTVTGVLSAARAAHEAGMLLCVSHRSGETEDTMMCDLAVAVGASFIKVGGPRRGDRTAKYNQLIRLATQMNGQSDC
ncbi:MAG TPA: hypothetical protein VJT15_12185 [Pyrinomonadaceae bacterium]|nr:hypothetical protein [Pyrinomonadaceae bacterium]